MHNLIDNCTTEVARVISFHIGEFVDAKGRVDLPTFDDLFDDQRVKDAISDEIDNAITWEQDIIDIWQTAEDRDNVEPHFEYTNSTTVQDLMISVIRQTVEDNFFDILSDACEQAVERHNHYEDTEFDNYEELQDWLVHNIG